MTDAAERLGGLIRRTPILRDSTLDGEVGHHCYLKAENLQETGAFKVRGAVTALSSLPSARQVVTASAGNFGQGLAFGARRMGCRARVMVPKGTPEIKIGRIERLGAEVAIEGEDFDETYALARRCATEGDVDFIPPFDDPQVIAGQGTLGLELLEDIGRLDAVAVPCGGGGLLAGVALAIKAHHPRVKILAVEPRSMPSLSSALAAGRPIRLASRPTLADGIAVREVGRLPFAIIRRLVDGVATVSEEEMAAAIRFLAVEMKQVVEGAGAAALAAVLQRPKELQGCREVGVLITGGNIDPATMATVLSPGRQRSVE